MQPLLLLCGLGPLTLALAVLSPSPARAPRPAPVAVVELERPEGIDGIEGTDEYTAKAAFLHHVIRYSTWPKEVFENGKSPIVVLIVGEDPFGRVIEKSFEGKRIHDRPIVVRRMLAPPEEPEQLEAQVVFCGKLEEKPELALKRLCRGQPVLLVGEDASFTRNGGAIRVFLEGKNLRFSVDLDVIADSGVTVSSQFLKLARKGLPGGGR